jgi:3-isopropylmalate/(R)-2-methylmalate dehydratase small subunit
MSGVTRIVRIEGRGIPLRGNDVDTDRIIPARFLKTVRFEGLESHVFEDDRAQWLSDGAHPFSDPRYRGASILVVNRNFGCGSSREHAPQALQRWGIGALVGESFSEIFFGNAVAIGLACLTASGEDVAWLQELIESAPETRLTVDLETLRVDSAGASRPLSLPAATRESLLTGMWDATGLLLHDYERIEDVASRLPYVTGF